MHLKKPKFIHRSSSLPVFGKAILQCMGCILLFLDRDLIDNLPYLCASLFSVLPPSLHQDIINYLCFYILPFTITRQGDSESLICQASASVSSVIMFVFQYANNPAHHCQLLECLMTLKHNVVKDLLCVIAYGTSSSRSSAAKLLFYYWPAFNADLFDRKVLLVKFNSEFSPELVTHSNHSNFFSFRRFNPIRVPTRQLHVHRKCRSIKSLLRPQRQHSALLGKSTTALLLHRMCQRNSP